MLKTRNTNHAWIEVSVRLPVTVQEATIAWAMDHGAAGVQEEYPGLGDLGDAGPLVSGDPSEWSGDAPTNPDDFTMLRLWFRSDRWTPRARSSFLAYVAGLLGGEPPQIRARRVVPMDYAAALRGEWRPIEVGQRLLVCPSFIRPPRDTDRVVLKLRPGMAFGTGTHFTTATCLQMVEEFMAGTPDPAEVRVLDVGTGSGVLAIAALLLGAREAVGLDVDRDALREARQNARLNRVADRFRTPRETPTVARSGRFHLVLANLVAPTIAALADFLVESVSPGGRLVTSGILLRQEAAVSQALTARGLSVREVLRDGTWVTMALDNSNQV